MTKPIRVSGRGASGVSFKGDRASPVGMKASAPLRPLPLDDAPETLGGRMKRDYEDPYRFQLPLRMPIILRVDGRAFHTFCAEMERPFDARLIRALNEVAIAIVREVAGAQLAYLQSDEISVLVHNYKRHKTEAWLSGNLQKTVSVVAGLASAHMTRAYPDAPRPPSFDARAFVLPEREVNNYFVWRQKDWERNSLSMLARSRYDDDVLVGKRRAEVHDLLHGVGVHWGDLPVHLKRGRVVVRRRGADGALGGWVVDEGIPRFDQDPAYVEQWLALEPEVA